MHNWMICINILPEANSKSPKKYRWMVQMHFSAFFAHLCQHHSTFSPDHSRHPYRSLHPRHPQPRPRCPLRLTWQVGDPLRCLVVLRPSSLKNGPLVVLLFRGFCWGWNTGPSYIGITSWWFQTFFIFTPIWGRFPFWLIFFRWVETTNQIIINYKNQDPYYPTSF